jgi:hypothetical protein
LGLAGLSTSKFSVKNATSELLNVACIAGGAFAAAKGIGFLDRKVNSSGNKLLGLGVPLAVTLIGVAGASMGKNAIVQSVAKGVAVGGAIKLAEKGLNKENLLSGLDEEPLMLPGIGSYGQAALPELPHYSENPNADVTTTGGDPQYYMGQPSEMLSGDEDFVAF